MTSHPARLLFLLSFLLLSLVSLNFVSLRSEGQKGKVLNEETSAPSYYYKFYLKDAALGAVLPGTTEKSSYITGATVTVQNQSSFDCVNGYDFSEDNGFYKLVCQSAGTMQIRISKNGYNTKNTSLSYYQGEIPTITLSKYVAPKPPPPPPPPPETIKDISLPTVFKEEGSKTTDLSKVADPAKVEGLVLDAKQAAIEFKEAVNLASSEVKDKFKKLDEFIKLDKNGVVELKSDLLPELNKKASVAMKQLSWIKTPKVWVNGKEDKSVVSNIKFEKGVLTFETNHFSIFQAVPEIIVREPKDGFSIKEQVLKVSGSVTDPGASLSISLNDQDLGPVKVNSASGEFKYLVETKEGSNKIVLSATSQNGATASASISGTLVFANNTLLYGSLGLLTLLSIVGVIVSIWWVKQKGKKTPDKSKQTAFPA